MTSWVLTIASGYGNHWDIAKEHMLWDMTKDRGIEEGDVVYFWLSKHGFIGRAEVSQPPTDLSGNDRLPWTDHGERQYTSRLRFARVTDLMRNQVTWTEVMKNTGLPANPSLGHKTEDSPAERWLASLFLDEAEAAFRDENDAQAAITNTGDTRTRAHAEITIRRGQPVFRRRLLEAYQERCAVTGSTAREVLEAAHIHRYEGEHTSVVENGLLLRSDIHTLFDLHRLTVIVDDAGYRVRVAPDITEDTYRSLDEQSLAVLPEMVSDRPGTALLKNHNEACDWLDRAHITDLQRGSEVARTVEGGVLAGGKR